MLIKKKRAHRLPILSAKNGKLRLQLEDWKNVAWSEVLNSAAHSDGRVRIWHDYWGTYLKGFSSQFNF